MNTYPDGLTFEDALRYRDSALLEWLLKNGLDPNGCTSTGVQLVFAAQMAGEDRMVLRLCEAGADMGLCTPDQCDAARLKVLPLRKGIEYAAEGLGLTPLEVCRRKMDAAKRHLNLRLFAELRDEERRLSHTAPKPNADALQELAAEMAATGDFNPQKCSNLRKLAAAALQHALVNDRADWLERLLDAGADPDAWMFPDDPDMKQQPLAYACGMRPGLVPVLLRHGANPSALAEGDVPVLNAARHGSWDNVELLLEAGANPFAQREDDTLLLAAVDRGRHELAGRMLLLGLDPNGVRSRPGGRNPLFLPLSWALHNGDLEMVKLLLDAGASPFLVDFDNDFPDASGGTILYYAECDAHDVRQPKRAEQAAALEYVYSRFPDIDRMPIPKQWDASVFHWRDYADYSLWNAAAYGLHMDARVLLHFCHASANARNKAGVSALEAAAARGHDHSVYELLHYGAEPVCTVETTPEVERLLQIYHARR